MYPLNEYCNSRRSIAPKCLLRARSIRRGQEGGCLSYGLKGRAIDACNVAHRVQQALQNWHPQHSINTRVLLRKADSLTLSYTTDGGEMLLRTRITYVADARRLTPFTDSG